MKLFELLNMVKKSIKNAYFTKDTIGKKDFGKDSLGIRPKSMFFRNYGKNLNIYEIKNTKIYKIVFKFFI